MKEYCTSKEDDISAVFNKQKSCRIDWCVIIELYAQFYLRFVFKQLYFIK
ncbi:MAG: hypothetical protein K0S01_1020 [Herbinix sp.]|jgi:hypothetical protein|nr:hypothetical protein [Herbinix sp.]